MRKASWPVWRVPSTSPGPRSSRSFSAMRKPSLVSRSTSRRWRAIADSGGWYSSTQLDFGAAAADPSAQLVQLGQAQALGVLDDHQAGVRHVDADFDHGRRHQQRRSRRP